MKWLLPQTKMLLLKSGIRKDVCFLRKLGIYEYK